MSDWWNCFLGWWNPLPSNEAVLYAAILPIAASILFLFIKFFNRKKIPITKNKNNTNIQTVNNGSAVNNSGSGNIHTGNGEIKTGDTHIKQTINIGLTLEQHEQRLKRREMEVRVVRVLNQC